MLLLIKKKIIIKFIHLHYVGVEASEISDMHLKIWASKTKESKVKSSDSFTSNDGPKRKKVDWLVSCFSPSFCLSFCITFREEDKNIFDYCRENNIDHISEAIGSQKVDVNTQDEEVATIQCLEICQVKLYWLHVRVAISSNNILLPWQH